MLAPRINRAARRYAAKAVQLPQRADIQRQGSASGTGSDTIGWTAYLEDWPCHFLAMKESPGSREEIMGGVGRSFSYEFFGPAIVISGSQTTAIVVSKGMRLLVKANGAQPQQVFNIDDVAIVGGVELKLLATLAS